MDTPIKENAAADLRDYLAEERTFLAWIRTGIALMGFGFVVAHFGIVPDEPDITQRASGAQPHELSLWFGTALVGIGVIVNLLSAWRHMRRVGQLNRGQFARRAGSEQGVAVAMFLALLGVALTTYMIVAVARPTNTLTTPVGGYHGRFEEAVFRR
jgi:putative membrane protein